MFTVGQLKDSVKGLLQGTNLDNVHNLHGALERAARTLVQQAYVKEASGRHQFNLFDGVYDYTAPELIFGGSFVDMRPQGVDRTPLDATYKSPVQLFDQTKIYTPNGYQITFEYVKGSPIMRVSSPRPQNMALIDTMSSVSGWAVGGGASSLAKDSTVYYKLPAALRFTLTGSGTGFIEKTLPVPLSLQAYQGVGTVFLALRTPNVSNLTSISLRIGSDSTNYVEVTATTAFTGALRTDEYMLVAFDLSSLPVGTPNWSAINYVRISCAHTGTIANIRVGYLFAALPYPTELLYQTAAIFLKTDGTLSKTISSDNDSLTLSDGAYTLYEVESALSIALQNGGTLQSVYVQTLMDKLHNPQTGLYVKHRGQNPSEEIPTVSSYY